MPEQPLLLRIEEAARLCNLGETKMREVVKEAKAGRKIGRSFRVDRKVLFDYISGMVSEE